MKICYICDLFPPSIGGIQKFSFDLINEISLSKKVEKVDVLAFCKKGKSVDKISDKLTIYRFRKYNKWIRGVIIFKELFKRLNFDIFHCTSLIPSSFYCNLLLNFFGKKVFTTVFGLDALSFLNKWYLKLLIAFTLKKSKVFFISNSTMHLVEKYYAVPHSRVIYPGINIPKFNSAYVKILKKKFNFKTKDFILLFVGRLIRRKGCDDLIKAIGLINDDRYKLLIVGDGLYKEELENLVKKRGLENRVFFAGNVNLVGNYYKLANVFSMPSKFIKEEGNVEGLGLVFLEAQSLGIPCIGTFSGGVPEVVKDGYSGFLVKESCPEEIKEKLLVLSMDKTIYMRFSKNAVKFSKKFSWNKCIQNHLTYYTMIKKFNGITQTSKIRYHL